MKGTIWEKGDYFPTSDEGRIDMDPAVVTLPRFEIPLTWAFSFDAPSLGKVTNLGMEDGEIVGDITFWKSAVREHYEVLLEDKLVRLGGYYTNVVRNDEGKVVESCELRSVGIVVSRDMYGNPANLIPEKPE